MRTRAICISVWIVAASAVAIGLWRGLGPERSEDGYHTVGDDEPSTPFVARRASRSWTDDTAGWSDGAEQLLPASPGQTDVPVQSIIGRLTPAGKNEVATAVAIGATDESNHIWLTARHAIADCTTVRIAAGVPGRGQPLLAAQILALHPSVDLALVETGRREGAVTSMPHVPFSSDDRVAIHVGFPTGRPAAIYSDFLGMTRVRWIDNSLPVEAYRVWAERAQIPAGLNRLNGLSGGATMNRRGELMGAVVGVSERRGRILTARHAHIATLLRGAQLPETSAKAQSLLDQDTYPSYARHLIEERRVARLNCERSP